MFFAELKQIALAFERLGVKCEEASFDVLNESEPVSVSDQTNRS